MSDTFLKDSVTVSSLNHESDSLQIEALYKKAHEDRLEFWAEQAEAIDWFVPWENILSWNIPHAKWFENGKLNASYNCLDRHLGTPTALKKALIWEGERGEERCMSYQELYEEVSRFSDVLKKLGVKKGDRIAIYLPMIPEAVVAMLSSCRIGAIHTVIFGGFSAEALQNRIEDAGAKILITADGTYRKGKHICLKQTADQAIENTNSIEKVVVIKRTHESVHWNSSKDLWYHELMKEAKFASAEMMDAEDDLFILYTSGTTGKPKGIVHTTGGYMVSVTTTTRLVFDIQEDDIYWCTADVGWITGHSYVVYGPLSNGMSVFLYEGAADYPQKDRFWKMIEKYKITVLYTAPTAIRMFMKWGETWPHGADLSSLRILGSVGEPINPEAWMWYFENIGSNRCPVVDTWWQTETGSIMIAPIKGHGPLKPGSATRALPGIDAVIVDEQGQRASRGYLTISSPWPSMLRGIYKDPVRYQNTYWKDGRYFTGDGAMCDEDGYFWISGRIDDVINVSGHRLGTMEIESALVDYNLVAEAAVIGVFHPIKGQAITAFVSLKETATGSDELEDLLKKHVAMRIGSFAKPEKILFICDLPKTRSGKIMRRLLRDIAEGRVIGDQTTLADPTVVQEIKGLYQED
ncbi:MAG: acetate--CoA ligase [Chlamydiae bacterium]|nr:acetate--CoA ligase [Chlamydiota bacterium]